MSSASLEYPNAGKLLIGALMFSVALAWNKTIYAIIEYAIGPEKDELVAMGIFTLAVTLLAIFTVYALRKSKVKIPK